jgi:dienelactone hydrolase
VLYKAGLATLLMDLLTKEEELIDEQTGELRFNIEFLADRLIGATTWLKKNSEAKKLAVGYFGSSTGAGAALIAAAKYPADIKTIVSRGGRPDLAMPYLKKVKASVLLIVGGNDIPVIRMNKEAMKQLSIEKKLEIVPGATHLFEEPGKLEEVAKLAAGWFTKHM